jgi:hypothetical protein
MGMPVVVVIVAVGVRGENHSIMLYYNITKVQLYGFPIRPADRLSDVSPTRLALGRGGVIGGRRIFWGTF